MKALVSAEYRLQSLVSALTQAKPTQIVT